MKVNQLKQRAAAAVFVAILVLSGCHKKVTPTPPPPPPRTPPAPTASITANPGAIQQGQSSTLSWTTANATQVTISGLGVVPASGSRYVTPTQSTDYTITAAGESGTSAHVTTRVTVTPPPPQVSAAPSLTEEELFTQNVHDVYFDYDKYDLRAVDTSAAEEDASFLKSHLGMKVLIEGHCDNRGSEEYNIALGQNRAEALKKAFTNAGVDSSRIRVVSYGAEKPFCAEDTEACWQQNRRDHLKLDH